MVKKYKTIYADPAWNEMGGVRLKEVLIGIIKQ